MQKYGLIGYPLKHSLSIGYFNEKFAAENIDAEYVNFEIPRIEDFMEVIAVSYTHLDVYKRQGSSVRQTQPWHLQAPLRDASH